MEEIQQKEKYFIIDFDSTFTTVEALDVLAEISLQNNPIREEAIREIQEITDRGMDGSLDLTESLEMRLAIIKPHREHIPELIKRLQKRADHGAFF